MKVRRGALFGLNLAVARAAIFWERVWPALWPATWVAGLFVAIALLDGFRFVPLWLHAILVIAFLVAFLAAIHRVFTRLPRINRSHARHRIEEDSGLEHRPLAALDDNLAAGFDDANTNLLWQAHRDRMRAAVGELRLKLPRAGFAKRDPWGLRAGLALALLIGFIAAGPDSGSRVARALVPEFSAGSLSNLVNLNIWITPPAYTELPPILLNASQRKAGAEGEDTETIRVPSGSALLAQVTGGGSQPVLKIDDTETAFERVEADAYLVETKLIEAGRIAVQQRGREIAAWAINVVPDAVPVVEFTAPPENSPRLRLRLPFEAKDDHGLKSVTASIRRIDGVAIPGGTDEIILQLPLPAQGKNEVKLRSSHDLTAHVWAGLPVLIHLLATDQFGQTGVSVVEPAVLPERRFNHPVARELVEIRKRLKTDPRSRTLARLKLDSVSDEPERFFADNVAYLSIRIARERLLRDKREQAVAEVQKMVWDTALRIEEGISALASRDLSEAQRKLLEALRNGATPEELERLMAEVQRAMDRFLQSLLQQLQQQGRISPQDPNDQFLGRDELQRMLDRARELMRQGSTEAARQLMAELQRMLENLRRGLARGGRQQNEQMRRSQQAMRELRDIIRRQQELLDKTFKQSKERGDAPLAKEQEEQNAIRQQLGKMMQRLGEMLGKVPPGLGRAEREMRQSEKSLGEGEPTAAMGAQTRALEELRRGAQSSARSLARRFQRGRGRGPGQRFGPGGRFGQFAGPRLHGLRPGNRDPFGRLTEEGGQGTATGSVKIPGESERQRARAILDELRRRAGDLWRPELELEYIERLLKRF